MRFAQLLPKHTAYPKDMQVAYARKMEKSESLRRARRRKRLEELLSEFGGAAQVARESGTPKSHFSAMLAAKRGLGDELAEKLEALYAKPPGWFDTVALLGVHDNIISHTKNKPDEFVIQQFNTGGSMGNGLLLRDQPGVIKSWRVSSEWLQKNVPSNTGADNLCIVTGFGPSMRPLFNPGDPLLVDRGVHRYEGDAIYFFRVGEEGFIKSLQSIPGVGLRVISANRENFEAWTIKPDMDFEVFGRVLKVWKSEDF